MAIPGVKYDDGNIGFSSSCFPVRPLLRPGDDGGGAWLVDQRAEQRRRFKAVLCAKPKTYSQIRQERIKTEKAARIDAQEEAAEITEVDENQIFDGFFLMKHCCVEDPADLCSVNISGCDLSEAKEEDFALFDNVAYINAAENILPFDCFKKFAILRELEVPLNGLRGLKVKDGEFPHLEMLDLSYNNLSKEDIMPLGILPNLKVLHLSGNNFKTLPADMVKPRQSSHHINIDNFPKLEVLMLDDNKLSDMSTFAVLAGLRKLKHLNMEKNEISSVPHLRVVEGKQYIEETAEPVSSAKRKRTKSRNSGRRSRNSTIKPDPAETPRDSSRSHIEGMTEEGLTVNAVPQNTVREENTARDGIQQNGSEGTGAKDPAESLSKIDFGDLDFNMEDLESKINQISLEDLQTSRTDVKEDTTGPVSEYHLPPPFPQLQYLNLAHNQIMEEEGLVALGAWPVLSELIIHDNPLTTERSGDPPLLKRFLKERLGIDIIRKKPRPIPKPSIDVSDKPGRKVKTRVPKIPKKNIDEILLAIEAPYKSPHPPIQSTPTKSSLDQSQPLPPIPVTPEVRSKSAGARPRSRESVGSEKPVQEAWSEQAADTEQNVADSEETEAQSFFMTQVGETDEKPAEEKEPKQEAKAKKRRQKKEKIADKYRGYEVLLDAAPEEEAEFVPPKDIQGNIRALQYVLNHPLVFKDSQVQLDKVHKPFHPYVKSTVKYDAGHKTKGDRIEEALEKIKDNTAMVEAGLSDVLNKKKKYKKDFPEAADLLGKVQEKYNSVRVSSMKNARGAKTSDRGMKKQT